MAALDRVAATALPAGAGRLRRGADAETEIEREAQADVEVGMKLITRRSVIQDTPNRFLKSYESDLDKKSWIGGKTRREIYNELLALDTETCPAESIDQIIGNPSWTALTCDECNKVVDAVVQVGEEPDYDSSTARLCLSCARKALNIFIAFP